MRFSEKQTHNRTAKIGTMIFWIVFLSLAVWFLSVPVRYLWTGIPDQLNRHTATEIAWFVVHIITGTLVFILAFFQFNKKLRSRNMWLHRLTGKLYVLCSVISVFILMLDIISKSACSPCQHSQAIVTSLWLIFSLLAWYFVRAGNIVRHQRFMVSSFICAAYFVTVRLIDQLAMKVFIAITPDMPSALFVSDVTAWLLPLACFWIYWLVMDKKSRKHLKNYAYLP